MIALLEEGQYFNLANVIIQTKQIIEGKDMHFIKLWLLFGNRQFVSLDQSSNFILSNCQM
jgi:hypothetical protein